MIDHLYSAWFRNQVATEDDQDREWVACIAIAAASSDEAQRWGDVLARDYAVRHTQEQFLHSTIELPSASLNLIDTRSLPRITAGEMVADGVIGW